MSLLPRYLFKSAALTTLIIAAVLTLIIWLTQSLRLLDLIINGGAPISLFASMLLLTVPKFFEVILPISLALGILYSLNRFSTDSELVVMQNSGLSPLHLGSGIIAFSIFIALVVFALSGWMTPLANRELDRLRDVVKSDYSIGLLRPGIFNTLGDDTTIYIAERTDLQDLRGIFIHLNRKKEIPTTITARYGGLIVENDKPYVVMFDGTRQQFNPKTGNVETLHFERYSLNLSLLAAAASKKPIEADEQTLTDIYDIPTTSLDAKTATNLRTAIHDRLSRPFLTLAFALISFVPFLTGRFNRKGNALRVLGIVIALLVLQSVHLGTSRIAGQSHVGLVLVYGIPGIVILLFTLQLLQQRQNPYWITPLNWLLGGKERLI